MRPLQRATCIQTDDKQGIEDDHDGPNLLDNLDAMAMDSDELGPIPRVHQHRDKVIVGLCSAPESDLVVIEMVQKDGGTAIHIYHGWAVDRVKGSTVGSRCQPLRSFVEVVDGWGETRERCDMNAVGLTKKELVGHGKSDTCLAQFGVCEEENGRVLHLTGGHI